MAGREGSERQGRGSAEVSGRHTQGAREQPRAHQARQTGENAGKPEGQGRALRGGSRGPTAAHHL